MLLSLSEMSPFPLREQIVRRVRQMILSGELPEHFQLPSIRSLAMTQRVGVITVQRAYEELERQGVIYARQGKGFYVAPLDQSDRRERAIQRVIEALGDPLEEAQLLGLSKEQILEIVRRALESRPDDPERDREEVAP